jgi:hypothetical protein
MVGQASDEQLAEGMADAEGRKLVLDEIFKRMSEHAEPSRIEGVDAVVHFEITDVPNGGTDVYEAVIRNGKVEISDEPSEQPKVKITTAPVPFLKLVTGQQSPGAVHDREAEAGGRRDVREPHDELLQDPDRRLGGDYPQDTTHRRVLGVAQLLRRRMTAQIEGDFVVFLIGMRINRIWKVWTWLPVFLAMPRMLRELEDHPESGFLGARQYAGSPIRPMLVQYWRSFEQLEAYARSKDSEHWPAWVAFNKRVGSSGDVGIWHETYLVPDGAYESVYNNMPAIGLGEATTLVPAAGRRATAAGRAGIREEAYPEGAPTERIEV